MEDLADGHVDKHLRQRSRGERQQHWRDLLLVIDEVGRGAVRAERCRRDRKAFDEASAALAGAQAELAAAEEKWLELEILREDVAGG